jgi:hypothetical protein
MEAVEGAPTLATQKFPAEVDEETALMAAREMEGIGLLHLLREGEVTAEGGDWKVSHDRADPAKNAKMNRIFALKSAASLLPYIKLIGMLAGFGLSTCYNLFAVPWRCSFREFAAGDPPQPPPPLQYGGSPRSTENLLVV